MTPVSEPSTDAVAGWCSRWLGAAPTRVLWSNHHLSHVYGIELEDARKIVVKVRSDSPRITATTEVQRALAGVGFPAPTPLTGPLPLGDASATAEALVEGGLQLHWDEDAPAKFATALADLVRLAPALPPEKLAPPPAWVWWDHNHAGLWPPADDRPFDLNAVPSTPIDEAARHARIRLAQYKAPPAVGHCDWESQNIRWLDGRLHVVHDWDSVAARPEATIAGAAGAVFTSTDESFAATVEQSAAFLEAYESARQLSWTRHDREAYWAAGLWVRSFNAKKESGDYPPPPSLDEFHREVDERIRLAGG
jgi:Ser/Thr protein kinase RdoA (MazF antagonist)